MVLELKTFGHRYVSIPSHYIMRTSKVWGGRPGVLSNPVLYLVHGSNSLNIVEMT